MPIHDWSRKPAGLFHHFHQQWAGSICNALNAGRLPQGFYALLDQRAAGVVPDVVTLEREPRVGEIHVPQGGIAVADAPPRTRFMSQASDEGIYAAKADRVAIYHPIGDVVAVIEIVSPGNKNSRHAIRSFAERRSNCSIREFMSRSSISSRPNAVTRKAFTRSSGTRSAKSRLSFRPTSRSLLRPIRLEYPRDHTSSR